jgi:hypothetical protein
MFSQKMAHKCASNVRAVLLVLLCWIGLNIMLGRMTLLQQVHLPRLRIALQLGGPQKS